MYAGELQRKSRGLSVELVLLGLNWYIDRCCFEMVFVFFLVEV